MRGRWKKKLAGIMTVLVFLSQIVPLPVFASENGRGLIPMSGQVVLDTDPEGGYEGDYVLIYNNSLSVNHIQSTGVISGIDTNVRMLRTRGGTEEDGKIQFHPETVELDENFSFSMFGQERKQYEKGDVHSFQIMNPITGRKKNVDFYVMYQGENCYIWAPVIENTAGTVKEDVEQEIVKEKEEESSSNKVQEEEESADTKPDEGKSEEKEPVQTKPEEGKQEEKEPVQTKPDEDKQEESPVLTNMLYQAGADSLMWTASSRRERRLRDRLEEMDESELSEEELEELRRKRLEEKELENEEIEAEKDKTEEKENSDKEEKLDKEADKEIESEEETKPDESKPEEEIKPDESKPEEETKPDKSKPEEETKPDESKPEEETKPDESKPEEETKPDESKPEEETKPDESKPEEETKPDENKPEEEIKPDESKPEEETKPDESKPEEETKPDESKPEEETKPDESKPEEETKPDEEEKPDENKPEKETKPDESKPEEETKPDESKPEEEIKPDESKPEEEIKPDESKPEEEIKPDESKPEEETKPDESKPEEKIPVQNQLYPIGLDMLEASLYDISLSYSDERGYHITEEMAEEAGEAFDSFYEEMTRNFGMPVDADSTGKISLLLYDIQDGNNPSGFIGGFFSSGDLYDTGNNTSMLHIDTYPSIYSPYISGSAKVSKSFSTMVHEFQHLLNYSSYFRNVENGISGARQMDTWLNEAMSMAAEEMIFPESALPMRKSYYNRDGYKEITNGKSVLNFDNSLESYSLSLLFASYLKEQTGGYQVFSDILNSYVDSEKDAIESSVAGSVLEELSFEDILASYRIALAVNDMKGVYGYRDNPLLQDLAPLVYTREGSTVNLEGGGSILVKTKNGSFTPGAGAGNDIRFVGIKVVDDEVLITKKPENMRLVEGETFQLEGYASVGGQDNAPIQWASSAPSVASVDTAGLVTALQTGKTSITASSSGMSDTFTLEVVPSFVEIENKVEKLEIGEEKEVVVSLRSLSGTETITWSSSADAVATVTADAADSKKAVVKGVGEGEATITATITGKTRDIVQDSFVVKVNKKAELSGYEGLSLEGKIIYITSSEGMYSLARLVNETPVPAGMENGLADYTVIQKVNVELSDWKPIGNNTSSFQGIFDGDGYKIVLNDMSMAEGFDFAGLFGINKGTIQNVNVDLRGTIYGKYAGAIAAVNHGVISNVILTVANDGEIIPKGNSSVAGGITAENRKDIKDVHVVNHGTIGGAASGRGGGVAGSSQGFTGDTAIIENVELYNNGLIISSDDTGGVVGLFQGWGGQGTRITGDILVTVTKNGEVTSTASGSASVGGVIGYAASFGPVAEIKDARITIRLDGKVISRSGQGCSGGVIGECGNKNSIMGDTRVTVTMGPESQISESSGAFGLIMGRDISGVNISKWVYAVPYGNTFPAFPGNSTLNTTTKRIEYPKQGNPTPVIMISGDSDTAVVNDGTDGIFKPVYAITDLKADSVVDDNLFLLDTASQMVRSKMDTKADYFDFHLLADGLPITVPAYLDLENPEIPQMNLEITSPHIAITEEEANQNPGVKQEVVTILATNARVADDAWTLKKFDGTNFVDYKPNQYISTNTLTKKEFTLKENGLYEITAQAKSVYDENQILLIRYVAVQDKAPDLPKDLTVDGQHLTASPTEIWTNLKDAKPVTGVPALQDSKVELVKIKTTNTTIESGQFKKESVPYQADTVNLGNNPDIEQDFILYETGRYSITGRGVGIAQGETRYINIDVDAPEPPSLKDSVGALLPPGEISAEIVYGVAEPIENLIQSPIHLEMSVDEGSFIQLTAREVSFTKQNKTIDFKTVDAAGNESEIVRYIIKQETPPPDPPKPPDPPNPPDPPKPDGGGGGGGGSGNPSKVTYRITATASAGGSVSPSNAEVIKGGSKTFFIKPEQGYMTTELLVDGQSVPINTTYQFQNVQEDHAIAAVFQAIPQPPAGGGGSSQPVGLPYYYTGNTIIFIGIADKVSGTMRYIAPADKTVYFKHNPKDFIDIDGHWARGNIDFVTEREIFVGTEVNKFAPQKDMTRAMFASVIGRMYERSYRDIPKTGKSSFLDVPENAYYTDYVRWAAENQVIAGVGGGKFEPDRNITREEMAAIMYRFANYLNLAAPVTASDLVYFDKQTISQWARESAKYCQTTGLIVGRDNNAFAPQATATRAEVAAVIERFVLNLLKQK